MVVRGAWKFCLAALPTLGALANDAPADCVFTAAKDADAGLRDRSEQDENVDREKVRNRQLLDHPVGRQRLVQNTRVGRHEAQVKREPGKCRGETGDDTGR